MDKDVETVPFLWIEEGKGKASTQRTRTRTKKKKEFAGWGSKQLIDFLESIGKETGKAMSQHDVTAIINQYVNGNKLLHPVKKKKVMCDDRLRALFGRKSVNRVKIFDLLEAHLAENQVDSEDEGFFSSEEKEEDASTVCKRQKVLSLGRITPPKKKVAEVSKSCLAAVSPENIKLVYLKRTLVQELLKDPETFERKVVGSFVRIKSDPLDIFQKNSHQLQLVTGVKTVGAADDNSSRTLLQISGTTEDIGISALSDDNFSEEECKDLRKRVKDGFLKQPTVGELEQKVEVLHEDITKHWLTRELALLRNLIDQANEKGWRHRVTECLDRRKLLQTRSEQSRLLREIPRVMAEEVKSETIPEDLPDGGTQDPDDSPKVADWDWDGGTQDPDDSPKVADWDWEPYYESPAIVPMTEVFKREDQAIAEIGTRINGHARSLSPEVGVLPESEPTTTATNGHEPAEPKETDLPKTEATGAETNNGCRESLNPDNRNFPRTEAISEEPNGHLQPSHSKETHACQFEEVRPKQVEVIDLSDDDDDEDVKVPSGGKPTPYIPPEQLMWHYVDPQGNVQGPFSLMSLKRWHDADYFPPDFRVWRTGQIPQEAVLLSYLLHQIFPK